MDCNHFRRQLDFARPRVTELDAVDIVALEQHLAACDSCREFARNLRGVDERFSAAMQDVTPRSGFREQLIVEVQSARLAWWRKICLRAGTVGTAAMIAWYAYPAPFLDADALAWVSQEQFGNQLSAEEWLLRQNSDFQFPPKFRSKYLVSFERREMFGVTGPVLTFVKRNSLARVLVLTPGQFRNLAGLPEGRVAENSVSTILVLRSENHPGVVYLVEVLNGPIEPFGTDDEPVVT